VNQGSGSFKELTIKNETDPGTTSWGDFGELLLPLVFWAISEPISLGFSHGFANIHQHPPG
jgi:hypothetical protein